MENLREYKKDFFMVQNYLFELLENKTITNTGFILYCFYRSLSGFEQMRFSYDYIRVNTGISKGSISSGNHDLEKAGLLYIKNNGPNKTFLITLVPNNCLPIRKLKRVVRPEYIEKEENEKVEISSEVKNENHKLRTNYNLYDYKPSEAILSFIEKYVQTWCDECKTSYYYKNDYKILEQFDDDELKEMEKYIPILWILGQDDDWIQKSDYTITVFVKEFKDGKLQARYPKTRFYYIDKQKEEKENE